MPFSRAATAGRLEPDFFVRIVLVRDQRDDVVSALQQQRQALVADLAVAKKKDARSLAMFKQQRVAHGIDNACTEAGDEAASHCGAKQAKAECR